MNINGFYRRFFLGFSYDLILKLLIKIGREEILTYQLNGGLIRPYQAICEEKTATVELGTTCG